MFKVLKKNKNYKIIIGLIIGFIFSGSIAVYAWYNDYADEVSYDPTGTWLYSTTVQGALDEIARRKECSVGHTCIDSFPANMTVNAVLDNVSSTYVSNANGIQFNAISSDTNGKGIYIRAGTENDQYPIYYYRGAVTNNNVLFAGFCWKIVRTTSTGGIKMIYNGTPSSGQCTNTTGTGTQLASTSKFNNSEISPADVGYMYGTRYEAASKTAMELRTSFKFGNNYSYNGSNYTLVDTVTTASSWSDSYDTLGNYHYTCWNTTGTCSAIYYVFFTSRSSASYFTLTNGKGIEQALDEMITSSTDTTSSAIKTAIDSWFSSNMTSYVNYLEDTIWCNDRGIYSVGAMNPNSGMMTAPIGTNSTPALLFNLYDRLNNYTPSLTCGSNDSFSVSSSNGNGKLTYPVGLLTVDEAMLAGGKEDTDNSSYYLYTNQDYWLCTSTAYNTLAAGVTEYNVYASGQLHTYRVIIAKGVRPVISLRKGAKLSGSGEPGNPYTVTFN